MTKMNLQFEPKKIDWWYWAVTLFFIGAAVGGWEAAYIVVILISALQVLHFWTRMKSLIAFDTQVRVVYFTFTLLGLIRSIRFPFYILLFAGTLMVVFFNRCSIALFLRKMPWNRHPVVSIQDNRHQKK